MPSPRINAALRVSSLVALASLALALSSPDLTAADPVRAPVTNSARPPRGDTELREWLTNMRVHHGFSLEEVQRATGLAPREILSAEARFGTQPGQRLTRAPGAPLRVLPYPGGRHPRLGFFDGAIDPQRETKVSVFTPWDDASYVVVDVPEAIFSNLGLTYLAHTHIQTLWEKQGVTLPRLEWLRDDRGELHFERTLPNGIAFGSRVKPTSANVGFELWLRNGTAARLTGLRVQNCVMLGYARGFEKQTLENKRFNQPLAAARSIDGRRWIITQWERCGRAWGNDQVPCVHSDPVFADCDPGETVRLRGWLSFYEGDQIEEELARLRSAPNAGAKP